MMNRIFTLLIIVISFITTQIANAQTKIVTTGNNLVNTADPYAADIVIGSDQGGNRHDASMMWWSTGSASRILNAGDIFYFSQWSSTAPNIALSATVGASSYFQGNVGIGTTTPVAGLSTEAGQNAAIAPLTAVPNGSAWIGGAGTTGGLSMGQFNGIYGYIQSRNKAANKTAYPLVINPLGGFVGIGTATPREALSVNGNIRSKQVVVELANWPDYVFKNDYALPSLSEVKSYIEQNHHLPGIPSAEEITKDGLNLGEMNNLLMKKVEELTLYLIEKDNKDKQKDALLISLQQQINDLKEN